MSRGSAGQIELGSPEKKKQNKKEEKEEYIQQLTSSGDNLARPVPLSRSGAAHVAALFVCGVLFNSSDSQSVSQPQISGFESKRLAYGAKTKNKTKKEEA